MTRRIILILIALAALGAVAGIVLWPESEEPAPVFNTDPSVDPDLPQDTGDQSPLDMLN